VVGTQAVLGAGRRLTSATGRGAGAIPVSNTRSIPALRAAIPELVSYDLPVAGVFQNCVIVSIQKEFPGHARRVMHAL